MKKYLISIVLLAGSLALVGCTSEADAAAATVTEVAAEGDQTKGDNVKTVAPVYNDPGQAPSSGGYRIEPKNKDDIRFKPDPKLGGGG